MFEFNEDPEYLLALATHLVVKTQDTWEKLVSRSAITVVRLENVVNKMLVMDKQVWAIFLLTCKDHGDAAYKRARSICPWPQSYNIRKIRFSSLTEETNFWRPLFLKYGYATTESNGSRTGYDSYALFYEEDMTLKQIVTSSIWLGFTTTSYTPGQMYPEPISPWRKDRIRVND